MIAALRTAELNAAIEAKQQANVLDIDTPELLLSALHGICTESHDRDIRLYNRLLIPCMEKLVVSPLVVLEINDERAAVLGHILSPGHVGGIPIFSIAHKGRLRWAKPTGHTGPREWKDWQRNNPNVHRRSNCSGLDFHYAVDAQSGFRIKPSRFCANATKVALSNIDAYGSSVGGATFSNYFDTATEDGASKMHVIPCLLIALRPCRPSMALVCRLVWISFRISMNPLATRALWLAGNVLDRLRPLVLLRWLLIYPA